MTVATQVEARGEKVEISAYQVPTATDAKSDRTHGSDTELGGPPEEACGLARPASPAPGRAVRLWAAAAAVGAAGLAAGMARRH